jgi:hypothetical protein
MVAAIKLELVAAIIGIRNKSPTAKQALDRIAAIYAVEALAAFAPVTNLVARRRDLAPLLGEFFAWADATLAKISAKSTRRRRSATRSIGTKHCRDL